MIWSFGLGGMVSRSVAMSLRVNMLTLRDGMPPKLVEVLKLFL